MTYDDMFDTDDDSTDAEPTDDTDDNRADGQPCPECHEAMKLYGAGEHKRLACPNGHVFETKWSPTEERHIPDYDLVAESRYNPTKLPVEHVNISPAGQMPDIDWENTKLTITDEAAEPTDTRDEDGDEADDGQEGQVVDLTTDSEPRRPIMQDYRALVAYVLGVLTGTFVVLALRNLAQYLR